MTSTIQLIGELLAPLCYAFLVLFAMLMYLMFRDGGWMCQWSGCRDHGTDSLTPSPTSFSINGRNYVYRSCYTCNRISVLKQNTINMNLSLCVACDEFYDDQIAGLRQAYSPTGEL